MKEREVNTFCSPHCGDYCCEFVVTVQDNALEKIASRLNEVKQKYGNEWGKSG